RKLAAAHWWDGTSINRVQDNYVVQWGDAGYDNPESGETEQKALPEGLEVMEESDYEALLSELPRKGPSAMDLLRACKKEGGCSISDLSPEAQAMVKRIQQSAMFNDPYAYGTRFRSGWPLSFQRKTQSISPIHCYGAVGVGRNYSPDTGSGAELYTVIGHSPRHLDRNIAVVGRVIEGIEHLSSLPRGKGQLGFYEDASKRVPITAIRLGNALAEEASPSFEYLDTEGETFAKYADARANRRDPFFIVPAGGADICNIPVPVRRVSGE
ncbi:peptidylprolyl isomerase, partial [Parasphingorhabdus sp.]|uniref:peptidylprolyl isomerase n=1 Tax=Parasphingorhabdus sp. TaxID=2709688 RepID=UPI0030019127